MRELASASLLDKARARPDLVRQVMRKARSEGYATRRRPCGPGWTKTCLWATAPRASSSRSATLSLACRPGMRVATASAGHAEMQLVPGLLAIPIPDGVSDESAAFGAVAAIAMQGLRQAEVEPGGSICVVGLGLVGQLTVRLALASGYDVIGVDLREWTTELVSRRGRSRVWSRTESARPMRSSTAPAVEASTPSLSLPPPTPPIPSCWPAIGSATAARSWLWATWASNWRGRPST